MIEDEVIKERLRALEQHMENARFIDEKADELASPMRLNNLKAEAYGAAATGNWDAMIAFLEQSRSTQYPDEPPLKHLYEMPFFANAEVCAEYLRDEVVGRSRYRGTLQGRLRILADAIDFVEQEQKAARDAENERRKREAIAKGVATRARKRAEAKAKAEAASPSLFSGEDIPLPTPVRQRKRAS